MLIKSSVSVLTILLTHEHVHDWSCAVDCCKEGGSGVGVVEVNQRGAFDAHPHAVTNDNHCMDGLLRWQGGN